jgi:hypothetical protein
MAAAWWNRAPDLWESAFSAPENRAGSRSYRFGFGRLELDSDDAALNRRFSELYPEGFVPEGEGSGPHVRCRVRSLDEPEVAAIRFEDPEELDPVRFCDVLFPARDYVPGPAAEGGWRTIAPREHPETPLIALKGPDAIADRRQGWQPLVANVGVNRLIRLQRDVLFFHAASASIGGRGAMFVGPKGSGKTTTSLALASRGHPFLGDEIAAVRAGDRLLLPFRRAASIRQGMRAAGVDRRLGEGAYVSETYPDGSPRILANVAELFPAAAPSQTVLDRVYFLRRFAPAPRIERFEFGREHFPLLTPIGSSMWDVPKGLQMLRLSRLMQQVRCYHLDAGGPDETAEMLERQEPIH